MTILTHSDECSGLTVLDDGTKAYWTEGYSDTLVVYQDGRREIVGPWDLEKHPLGERLTSLEGDMRPMTPAEEADFDTIREAM